MHGLTLPSAHPVRSLLSYPCSDDVETEAQEGEGAYRISGLGRTHTACLQPGTAASACLALHLDISPSHWAWSGSEGLHQMNILLAAPRDIGGREAGNHFGLPFPSKQYLCFWLFCLKKGPRHATCLASCWSPQPVFPVCLCVPLMCSMLTSPDQESPRAAGTFTWLQESLLQASEMKTG